MNDIYDETGPGLGAGARARAMARVRVRVRARARARARVRVRVGVRVRATFRVRVRVSWIGTAATSLYPILLHRRNRRKTITEITKESNGCCSPEGQTTDPTHKNAA